MSVSQRASRDYIVVLALGALASTVVCLRFLARSLCKASFFADDYVIVASLVVMFFFVADAGIMVYLGGIGQHILTPSQHGVYFKAGLISEILYVLCISLTKVSILLLYSRLFPTKRLLLAAKAIGFIVASWCLTSILVTIFQCHPISGAWAPSPETRCIAYFKFQFGISIANTLTDFIVLCLPLHVVWHLPLKVRQKIVLSGIFLLGGFVFVASFMRTIALRKVDPADLPYTVLSGASWSLIEAELAITCACLPTLRPLVSNTEWMKRTKDRLSVYSRFPHISRTGEKHTSWHNRIVSIAGSDDSDDRVHRYAKANDSTTGEATLVNDWSNQMQGRADCLEPKRTTANYENSMV